MVSQKAQIQLRKGQKDQAFQNFKKILRKNPRGYYSTMILASYPSWQSHDPFKTALKPELGTGKLVAANRQIMSFPGLDDPGGFKLDLEKSRYPLAFDEIVDPVTKLIGLDKFLLLSIMRAESHYRINVRSQVGARGLIQMMPYTAIKVARLIGDENFDFERFENPVVNIAYGAYYLKHLLNYYQGNYFLAVAAYNAGPQAVNKWLKGCGACGIDEFVESIPFNETRRYVKKVVRFLARYYEIYQGKEKFDSLPELPARVDESIVIF